MLIHFEGSDSRIQHVGGWRLEIAFFEGDSWFKKGKECRQYPFQATVAGR